jgi:hypothetical protein
MVASGVRHWIQVNQDILAKGADEANRLMKKIKSQQKKTNRVKSMVKSTLEGAVQQIKREIRSDVDHFFDSRYGEVLPSLLDFVKSYNIPLHQYQDRVAADGFSSTLYLVFQDFKHGIDTFMAENINPQIFSFVKDEEDKVKEYFDTITGPYEVMVNDALTEYNVAMESLGLGAASDYRKPAGDLDLKTLKQAKNLTFPAAAATMNYSTAIKTEAIMRLGMYNFIKQIKRLIRQPVKDEAANAMSALKDAVKRMKKETEESLVFHFKNYKENMKFQYIFQLVDAVSDNINNVLMERFHDYSQDLSQLTGSMAKNQVNTEQLAESLKESAAMVAEITASIRQFGEKLKNQ